MKHSLHALILCTAHGWTVTEVKCCSHETLSCFQSRGFGWLQAAYAKEDVMHVIKHQNNTTEPYSPFFTAS
jgi:hypothetical protein